MGRDTPLSIPKGQSVPCSPLQPGSTAQHCRPPHYSLGLSGTGNTPPCAGAQARHVLLGAAALVIGTVIAMSNHTLPRLPREQPRKARSVPLSLLRREDGGERHGATAAAQLSAPGKLRHGGAQLLEGVGQGWASPGVPWQAGEGGEVTQCRAGSALWGTRRVPVLQPLALASFPAPAHAACHQL